MPTYDYVCKECNHQFEAFQKMTDPHLKTCPHCGGEVVRKIGLGAGMIFKGSGFYETDYKTHAKKAKKTVETSNGNKKSNTKTSSVAS